ncbi:hypothetical protein NA56DRAFT_700078 [Hyaloscypha hepaticicola]|uniref:Uncharacterized protein n=1 Tax=Hyaloscypha hepaticicola TaxID=2082293 RepID=A0A2J6QDW9_9HELO|nr:hypothetical protein NA56DRAFT_700078 [Hyaloscypha hepaticicola]
MSAPWGDFNLLGFLSYLPIPLYAENLRVHSAILSAVLDELYLPTSITGCIDAFQVLWHLHPDDMLDEMAAGKGRRCVSSVSSVRNGNRFALANGALLNYLRLRPHHKLLITSEGLRRPTIVNLVFLCPCLRSQRRRRQMHVVQLLLRLFQAAEVLGLALLAVQLYMAGLFIAATLVMCISASTVVLLLLHLFASLRFGTGRKIFEDTVQTSKRGAPLDVHVVVPHDNAPTMDVLLGYSSQLHGLTNMGPQLIQAYPVWKVLGRALALILTLQAALLMSLGPPWLLRRLIDPATSVLGMGMMCDVEVRRVAPIVFSGRRAALVFISTLPVSPRASRWDWMDPFIPPNQRRREWEREVERTRLFSSSTATRDRGEARGEGGGEDSGSRPLRRWESILRHEAVRARERADFSAALSYFEVMTGLREDDSRGSGKVKFMILIQA